MGLFESALDELDEWTHRDIFRRLPRRSRPRQGDPHDGFLTPDRAAAVMGVSEADVHALAGRGMLDSTRIGGRLLIRPAVLSVLAVREVRT